MLIFVAPIFFIVPAITANSVTWIRCPSNPNELDSQWPATPSALTYNLQALLSLVSKKEYTREIHSRLLPHKIKLEYKTLRQWERGRGISCPCPMASLRNLYWFITENKLHCYPSELSLAKVFSQVVEIDSEAWNTTAPNNWNNQRAAQGQDEADEEQTHEYLPGELEVIDTEYSDDPEVDTAFQYFSYGPAKHLSILIHLHTDELDQYREDLISTDEHIKAAPTLYWDIVEQIKDWTKLYYELDAFLNTVRAFRKSLWVLRNRQATPEELKRLTQGKELKRPLSKKIVECFGSLCNNKKRPNLNT
ncbi:hypothetical protein TWF730_011161 [Orbilia blumenaviensis]|uniref:Uncharacterized protein n=1 Tax=Orbilia blumenaviensis TaxID=1796055 RepID=A0AAV9UJK4_9PEZI